MRIMLDTMVNILV